MLSRQAWLLTIGADRVDLDGFAGYGSECHGVAEDLTTSFEHRAIDDECRHVRTKSRERERGRRESVRRPQAVEVDVRLSERQKADE